MKSSRQIMNDDQSQLDFVFVHLLIFQHIIMRLSNFTPWLQKGFVGQSGFTGEFRHC